MNARVAFDTHTFIKRLEAAGMSAAQAEALAAAMGDIVLPAVATKPDVKELGQDLRTEMKQLGHDLRDEMKELDRRLTTEMKQLGHDLRGETTRLGHDLRTEVKQLGHDLRDEMKDLELRLTSSLTNRMGAIIGGVGALIVAILGVLVTMS